MSAKVRVWAGLFWLGALTACPPQKSTYTYEGCPNEDGVCSRDITLACAVNTIDARYSECAVDTDCVQPPEAEVENECIPVTRCRKRLINAAHVAEYEAEVIDEIKKYCDELNCGWFTDAACTGPEGNIAACVDGQCRFVESTD